MSYALNNATTQDGYDTARTLSCPNTRRLNIDVTVAAVYVQLGHGTPASVWDTETFFAPSFRSLERACDAVRVRSAKAGTPAQVTVAALTREDLGQ